MTAIACEPAVSLGLADPSWSSCGAAFASLAALSWSERASSHFSLSEEPDAGAAATTKPSGQAKCSPLGS